MKDPKLAEIAKALRESEIPPHFEPDELRLLIHVLGRVADGRPVSLQQVEQIASTLQMPAGAATAFIRQVSERDGEGNVVGLLGLSQNTHPHRFMINGHPLSTWCAWDGLFLPAVLRQTAKLESSCPATKKKIRLAVAPDKVEQCEPAGAVISIVVPETTKRGRESVEEIWMAFCHFVHFFHSTEAASGWFAGRKMPVSILSVEEGHRLGRMAFRDLLAYV